MKEVKYGTVAWGLIVKDFLMSQRGKWKKYIASVLKKKKSHDAPTC